ncbi:reverse transcriptase domain-containing protein [Tanacetum coccineum]
MFVWVTLDTAHATPWSDFKAMFIRKYCPRNEVKQMENELWNLKVKGTNLTAYNQRFQELILLCPEMVPNTDRLLERYIEGLPLNIKGNVTSSKLVDLHEAIEMTQGLMYQVVQELGENSGQQGCLQSGQVLTLAIKLTAGSVDVNTRSMLPPTCHICGGRGHKVKGLPEAHPSRKPKRPGKQGGMESMLLDLDGRKGHYRTSVRTIEVKAVEIKFEATNKILRTIRGRQGTLGK